MRIQADVLYDRYLKTPITDKRTIGDMYNILFKDTVKKFDNKYKSELQQMSQPLKRLARYYEKFVFDSIESTEQSDVTYNALLVMYARLCHLTSELTYNVLHTKGYLKTLLIECSMIEQIYINIFQDLHNDETLMKRKRQSGYEYYKRPELRCTYNKHIKEDNAIEKSLLANKRQRNEDDIAINLLR